jgi:hypothetical protein
MLIEKIIHNSFAIIFPIILPYEETLVFNYQVYWKYTFTLILLGLIYVNNVFTENRNQSNFPFIYSLRLLEIL